jgi:ankyrin repeat protein
MLSINATDPLAVTVKKTIHEGDLDGLKMLLAENNGLAKATIVDARGGSRTLLHIVADWPGHFPNGARTVAVLIAAGADPNQPHPQKVDETPLHWAASSDDVEVLDALLDGGADIEKPGACIAGGTALDDAVAFGQWRAARRLVERGAQTALWHAAALGLMERVEEHFAGSPAAARYPWGKGSAEPLDEVTIAFWCACHGGQQRAAEYLLARGARLNWVSVWDGLTPLDAAERSNALELVDWLRGHGAKSAKE